MARPISRPARSLIATLVMLGALHGCSGSDVDALLKSGKGYAEKRDYPAAIIEFKSALQKDPDNGEVRFLLGSALRMNGDVAAAAIELQKAAAAGYDPDKVTPELLLALLEGGKNAEVLEGASRSKAQKASARATVLALEGEASLYGGKVEQAENLFDEALRLDAGNARAKLGRSKLAASRGDLAAARRLVDEVLAADPGYEAAVFQKALLLQLQGNIPEALKRYEEAAALRPSNLRAHFSIATLLMDEGNIDGATARVQALKKVAPASPTTVYLEALIAYRKGEVTLARDMVREVLKVVPDYAPANTLAGAIAYDLEAYAEAEEQLQKALSAQADSAGARRMLASTYARTGQVGKARATLEPLLKDPEPEVPTLLLAGEINLLGGDLRRAKEYFERAAKAAPKNTEARTRLGQLELASGETGRALEDLEAASSLDPSKLGADVALVRYYVGRREFDKALAAAKVLAGKQPDSPVTHNVIGTVHLARSDIASARASFEKALSLQPSFLPAARSLAVIDTQEGKLDAAMKRYERVTEADPKQDEAWLALAALKQQIGAKPAEVRDLIDRALAANPASIQAKLAKINYLLTTGDAKGAVAAALDAHAAHPSNVAVLDALAGAQLKAMELDQAIANYGKLASLMPKSGAPFLGLAGAHVARGDWNAASEALRRATQVEPDWLPAREAQVLLGLSAQRFDYAMNAAKSIQQAWPKLPTGYVAEADILAAQKRWSEAEAVLRNASQRVDNSVIPAKLYGVLEKQGKVAEADMVAATWSAQHPKDPTVAAAVAQSYLGRKDYRSAARWYETAIKAQPKNPLLMNNLAWCLGELNDPKALEVARQALELAPRNPAVLDTAGTLYVKRGDVEKGLDLLREAVALAPQQASLRLSLGRALAAVGKKADARTELEAIAKLQGADAVKQEALKLLSSL